MSRIDTPTLQCDRCKHTTQDIREMGSFQKLTHSHMSGRDEWDLCKDCWLAFKSFIAGPAS